MSKSKAIFSGVAWTIIHNISSILYGIISVPFLINYFGEDEYGLIGLALSVNVYIQLLDMGMTSSNVRFFSVFIAKNEKNNVQKLFSLTHLFYFILGIINTILLFGLSFFIEDIFKVTPEQSVILRNLLWILALNATFSWVSICFDQFLKANELINWIKKRSALLKLLQFVVLAFTIIFKLSIELYFTSYIFIATIILPITIIKAKNIDKTLKLRFSFNMTMFKEISPYALSVFSFSIFQFIAFNSRPLLLGNITGPSAVAQFNIMTTIASVVTILSGSFMQVLLPIVTKMTVNSEWKSIHKIINDGTKYVTIILSFIVFILIVALDELFILYVGVEYVKLTKWMIFWLLTLLFNHRNVMTSLVFTENNLQSVSIMSAVAMTLAVASYILLVPKFGIGGVVIGFMIHELTHTLFYYLYFLPVKFRLNTSKIFFKSVLPVWLILGGACITLVTSLSFLSLSGSIWVNFFLKTFLLGVIMLILTWFVLLNKKDKQFLLSNIHL